MSRRTLVQLLRYGVVGLASNTVGFLLYLLLTDGIGMDPKLAMSLLYVVGVLQTFLFNRNWTFSHDGPKRRALIRYFCAYGFGYLVNLAVLVILVDHFRLPHQPVQGAMIFVLAGLLFLLQKFWVFRPAHPPREAMKDQG